MKLKRHFCIQTSEDYKAQKPIVDKRSADRLLYLCQKHGGIYTKVCRSASFAKSPSKHYFVQLGQYISTLNNVLPQEYTKTLSAVQDKQPFRPWKQMEAVFIEDTRQRPTDVFTSIDEMPVAAASLAQVHRAKTRDGQDVAVKIQYPALREQISADMWTVRLCTKVLGLLFPDYEYSWLIPEFEASLRNETNFLQEAHNAERVAAMFKSNARVHVPAIRRDLSTQRVLVMEYINGIKVNDHAGLAAMGVKETELASTVSSVFGDMVHVHGFVHVDPHPGNLFVRQHGKDWQLVILDHGMYRRLTPQFRAAYCRLWKALITQDLEAGQRASIELGLGADAYDALSLILTYRSADSKASAGSRMSSAEVERLRQKYSKVTQADLNAFMKALPRDLLFVSRSTNMVRALNLELGGTSRQRFKITGECAIRGLVLTEAVADFAAVAAEHSANQRRQDVAAPLVADVASASTESSTRLQRLWRRLVYGQPDAGPQTYLNAIASGSIITDPTESELQLLNGGGAVGSWWRQIELASELAQLRLRLLLIDAGFALASWYGTFVPHVGSRHGDKDAG
jgi:aarF domain-containing kinase